MMINQAGNLNKEDNEIFNNIADSFELLMYENYESEVMLYVNGKRLNQP